MLSLTLFYLAISAIFLYIEYKAGSEVSIYEYGMKGLKHIWNYGVPLQLSFNPSYAKNTTWISLEDMYNNSSSFCMQSNIHFDNITTDDSPAWTPTQTSNDDDFVTPTPTQKFTNKKGRNSLIVIDKNWSVPNNKNVSNYEGMCLFSGIMISSVLAGGVVAYLTTQHIVFCLYHLHDCPDLPPQRPSRIRRPRHPRPRPLPQMASWDSPPMRPAPLPLGTPVRKQLNPEWEMRLQRWE